MVIFTFRIKRAPIQKMSSRTENPSSKHHVIPTEYERYVRNNSYLECKPKNAEFTFKVDKSFTPSVSCHKQIYTCIVYIRPSCHASLTEYARYVRNNSECKPKNAEFTFKVDKLFTRSVTNRSQIM